MSIPHIEDLEPEEFLYVIQNLRNMRWTEKLDGSNLVLGVVNWPQVPPPPGETETYLEIYTSRSSKGGDQIYDEALYPHEVQFNGFRSAHAALSTVEDLITEILVPGDQVELEILYGRQPNAIVYGDNYIVPLRMINGDPAKLEQITKALSHLDLTSSCKRMVTTTGYELRRCNVSDNWNVRPVPKVDQTFLRVIPDILPSTTEQFLRNNPRSNFKTKRAYKEFCLPHMRSVKEFLLTHVIQKLKPAYRTVEVRHYEDFGIEGVVLLDPQTNKQYKLVDKEGFTAINHFNHAIRNEIKKTSYSKFHNEFVTIGYLDESIYDLMLRDISAITIEGLHPYLQLTRKIKKFHNIHAFVADWNCWNINKEYEGVDTDVIIVEKAKRPILSKIRTAMQRLLLGLDQFTYHAEHYRLKLPSGKEIRYTSDVYDRTLLMFAQVHADLDHMYQEIVDAQFPEDLAIAIYGKSLDCIR